MKIANAISLAVKLMALVAVMASCSAPVATGVPSQTSSAALSTATSPGQVSWQQKWDEMVTAAKAEGSVVIYGATGPEVRRGVGEAFYQKFGLRIEWVSGRANEMVQKILSERRANIYAADIISGGTMSSMNILKPAGVLQNLEPELILPEVTDTSKWFQGKLWWVDKERTHLAYAAIAFPAVVINTDLVKKEEIGSYRDLLNAKWKGKILMDNPFTGGPGNSWVTAIGYNIMDNAFLEALARQEPFILQDRRQEIEWIARGKYPIGLGQSTAEINEFIKTGVSNIAVITPKEGTWLSQSAGAISLLEKPGHPNAARVFLNWVLSKEGQTTICKAQGYQSARIDVPTDYVEPWSLRQPGVTYHDAINLESQLKKDEYVDIARRIFAQR